MTKNRKCYRYLAEFIEFIHIIITLISISTMVLIFLSPYLKIYCAVWLCGLGLVELIYGNCPLTVKEFEFRKKAGEDVELSLFAPRFFKQYFNLNIPDWLARHFVVLYFIIGIMVILETSVTYIQNLS